LARSPTEVRVLGAILQQSLTFGRFEL